MWRAKFGGMEASLALRLRELDAENAKLKCLTVADDFSRERIDIAVDLWDERLVRHEAAIPSCLVPRLLIRSSDRQRLDVHQMGLYCMGADPLYPSHPHRAWAAYAVESGYIESFNRHSRDECLNEYWIKTLPQTRNVIIKWRRDYNEFRPHSSIGRIPPTRFAALHRQHAGDAAYPIKPAKDQID